jgi:serine/threonine protein kinase
LYVLVAGYPADSLQVAFNIIHTAHYRNLRQLPNLPNDLPDSFYDLLEQLLNYRHKRRASAGDLLDHEFVAFHQHLENGDLVSSVGLSVEEIAAAAAAGPEFADIVSGTSRTNRTTSMSLRGSVDRHNLFLGFKRFERSLTALLATMLSKKELQTLVNILLERYGTMKQEQAKAADSFPPVVKPATISESNSAAVEGAHDGSQSSDRQQLKVILVRDLRAILQQEFKNATINETIDNLPNADEFGSFAYHASLLDDFCPSQVQQLGRGDGSRHSRGSSIRRNLSIFELQGATDAIFDKDSNGSVRSAGSFRGFRSKNGSRNGSKKNSMTVASASVVANSVHGSTVFVSKNTGEYKNNLAAASSSIRRAQSTALLSKA